MKSGVMLTDLNARTGLFTPPGILCWARENNCLDCVICMKVALIKCFNRDFYTDKNFRPYEYDNAVNASLENDSRVVKPSLKKKCNE
jgi:hypothetical protein